MKNAAIAAKSAALPKIPTELPDQFVSGPMDEWSLNRRYKELEGLQTLSDTGPTRLSAAAP